MYQAFVSVVLTILSLFTSLKGLSSGQGAKRTEGIYLKYGPAAEQCMDIFLPENVGDTADVVFLIHGGTWTYGDQLEFDEYAKQAAKYGYVGVSADHRKLSNNVRAAGMNEDILAAVSALKDYLTANGIVPRGMAVAGHSSGAHLALMYSYTHHQDSPIPISFVVGASAPTDLTLLGRSAVLASGQYFLMTALAEEEISGLTVNTDAARAALAKVDPVDVVTPDVPPTLLVHGDADDLIVYENAAMLYEILKENGVDAELVAFPGEGHHIRTAPEALRQLLMERTLAWTEKYFQR